MNPIYYRSEELPSRKYSLKYVTEELFFFFRETERTEAKLGVKTEHSSLRCLTSLW